MSEPIQPPLRHRIFFRVEAVLFRHLLGFDPMVTRYVCRACIALDHEHCEGVNGHPSLCQCDDPDPTIHLHAHPHDPANYWPYPGATKPVEGEYNPDLADLYAYADELLEEEESGFGELGEMREVLRGSDSLPVFTDTGLDDRQSQP